MFLRKDENHIVNRLFGINDMVSTCIMDWEEEYKLDMATHNGFDIVESPFRKVKGSYVKRDRGSHSKRFGTSFEDEEAFAEQYSCPCGEIRGTRYEGEICPSCHRPVENVGVNMKMTGWISLENHYFIHPIAYAIMSDLIGNKEFTEIVKYDMDIDLNGHAIQKDHKNPFFGIGVIGFRKRFMEIMVYYMRKKKKNTKKRRVISELISMYDNGLLFQRRIPVYSAILRDTKYTSEEYYFHKVDKKINMIFTQVRLLNGWRETDANTEDEKSLMDGLALSNLQKYLMDYWSLTCTDMSGKEGIIKDGLIGGRVNFSARDVIVPDPSLKVNEVRLGYILFLELFKLELVSMIVRMRDVSYNEAIEEWSYARTHFDEKTWRLMNHFNDKFKPMVIINRNPSINIGSLMVFRVKNIERGYTETFVMKMPIQPLGKYNADFDGDRLNLVSLKLEDHEKEIRQHFCPRSSLQISRITGNYDGEMGLIKDQIVGLHLFNTI